MPTDTPSVTLYAAVIGGAAAAVFSGVFAVWSNWIARRSDERKHMRELAVKVAADNWKYFFERNKDRFPDAEALSVFIINAMNIISFVDGKFKTPEQIRAHMRKGFADTDVVSEEYQYRKQHQGAPKTK